MGTRTRQRAAFVILLNGPISKLTARLLPNNKASAERYTDSKGITGVHG